jgi:hypothetical protein
MNEAYNIFISWSGPRSKWAAEALRDWLPLIIQTTKPWMSSADIEKGSRGLDEISGRLQGVKIGIVCLTPENLTEPWILYEAGALSKTIDDKTRLCTYLLGGLQFQDVKFPLGMFQATNADKDDTRKLVRTINRAVSENPVAEGNLDVLFEHLWPQLERKLTTLPSPDRVAAPKRKSEDMVTEILEIVRAEVNSRESLQARMANIENILSRAPFAERFPNLLTAHYSNGNPFVWSSPGAGQPSRFVAGYPNTFDLNGLPLDPTPITPTPKEPEKGDKK